VPSGCFLSYSLNQKKLPVDIFILSGNHNFIVALFISFRLNSFFALKVDHLIEED
jgi:hypothetical protein